MWECIRKNLKALTNAWRYIPEVAKMILYEVTGRKLNSAATSTSCTPYNSAQERFSKSTHMENLDNFLVFPNHSSTCPNPSNLPQDNLTIMVDHPRATVMWLSRDHGVLLCHWDVCPNFTMLGTTTNTFAPFAQIEGEPNIQIDNYDSFRNILKMTFCDDYTLYFFGPHAHHVPLPA